MLQENAPSRRQLDPKLGFEVKSISMRQRSRDDIRADPDSQVYAISKETPDAQRIQSPIKPILKPTLLAVQDVSQDWASMVARISAMEIQIEGMKARHESEIEGMKARHERAEADLRKVVPLANQQYLVLCAETAKLVIDHLDRMLLAIVGKRLENVDAEMKSALLSGPFARFKAREHDNSSPKLCGGFSDLLKAIQGGQAEKFNIIIDKIESEFLRENTEFTSEKLRDQVSKFANLKVDRDMASHHISTDSKPNRAKLINDFISAGGLETQPSLLACAPFIMLGIKFLVEKPQQIKICSQLVLALDHPVKKRTSQEVSIQVKDRFVPGEELKICAPVGWFGEGSMKKGRKMMREQAGWRFQGDVGVPKNGLPYGCELVKFYEVTGTYERGAKFIINPDVDKEEICLSSWNQMNEPDYEFVSKNLI